MPWTPVGEVDVLDHTCYSAAVVCNSQCNDVVWEQSTKSQPRCTLFSPFAGFTHYIGDLVRMQYNSFVHTLWFDCIPQWVDIPFTTSYENAPNAST